MKKPALTLILTLFLPLALAQLCFASTTISLSTPKLQLPLHQSFPVQVNLTSNDNTLGTDLVLNYDPQALTLVSIVPGDLYPDYSSTDDLPINGTIYLSGVSELTQGTTPNGTFATLTFTPIQAGSTSISIAYDPQKPTLTGVIPFETDESNLLTQAPQPLNLQIKQPGPFSFLFNLFQAFLRFINPKKV